MSLEISKMTDQDLKLLWDELIGTYLESREDLDNEYKDDNGKFVPKEERAVYYQAYNDIAGELDFAILAVMNCNPRKALENILEENPNLNTKDRKEVVSEIANLVNLEHEARL